MDMRPIPGHDRYRLSEQGLVRDLESGQFIKPALDAEGRRFVRLDGELHRITDLIAQVYGPVTGNVASENGEPESDKPAAAPAPKETKPVRRRTSHMSEDRPRRKRQQSDDEASKDAD